MSLAQILGLTGQTNIPKRFQPFYQQAGSEALVRYAPEWDNLSQLRAASAQTMRQRVAQARTAGAILNNAAGMAIKDIQANPNASSPALQSLLPMLTQRQQDAPIVANQQALQATNEHLQDLDKIHAQRASLLGQIGTFTTGRATDLIGSDRKLRHDTNQANKQFKQQLLTSGVTPSGKVRPGGPKDPKATQLPKTPSTIATPPSGYTGSPADWNNLSRSQRDAWVKQHPSGKGKASPAQDAFKNKYGVSLQTAAQHGAASDRISSRVTDATAFKKAGLSRQDAAAALVAGIPDETVTDPKTGKKSKKQGVKTWGNNIWTSIALDVAFDGHISAKNANLLHRRGISVARLGLPGTRPRRPGGAPTAAPGVGSQGSRPT